MTKSMWLAFWLIALIGGTPIAAFEYMRVMPACAADTDCWEADGEERARNTEKFRATAPYRAIYGELEWLFVCGVLVGASIAAARIQRGLSYGNVPVGRINLTEL